MTSPKNEDAIHFAPNHTKSLCGRTGGLIIPVISQVTCGSCTRRIERADACDLQIWRLEIINAEAKIAHPLTFQTALVEITDHVKAALTESRREALERACDLASQIEHVIADTRERTLGFMLAQSIKREKEIEKEIENAS